MLALELRRSIYSTEPKNPTSATGVGGDPVRQVINIATDDSPAARFRIIQRHVLHTKNARVSSDRWCFLGCGLRRHCLISWFNDGRLGVGHPVAPYRLGTRMSGQNCNDNGNNADNDDNATDNGGQNLSS